MRLSDRATGRTVWVRRVEEVDALGWSPDGRALALASGQSLVVWRQGRRPHQFERLPAIEGGYYDGVIGFVWSPDGRRILVRLYQSGGKDVNDGDLVCLDTAGWHLSPVAPGVAGEQWLGPDRVRYQTLHLVQRGDVERLVSDDRLHIWVCP